MKYMMSWRERSFGSAREYEAAQEHILQMMQHWTAPDSITFHQFLVRLGEYGGYAVVETDDLSALHQMTSTFALFAFTIEPVIEIGEALAAEGAAVAFRQSFPR